MIAAARQRLPGVRFEVADIAAWDDPGGYDLIFANAVLHWLPGHAALLPALLAKLAPGGSLAVQMPDNLDEPAHALMRETAAGGPWAGKLGGAAAAREARHDAGLVLAAAPRAMRRGWRSGGRSITIRCAGGARGRGGLVPRHRPPAVPRAARRGRAGRLPRALRGGAGRGLSGRAGRDGAPALPAAVHRRGALRPVAGLGDRGKWLSVVSAAEGEG